MLSRISLGALLVALASQTPAFAQSAWVAAAGCAVPSGGGNTFYIDPIKGSDAGNGSAEHPWKTLATVVTNGSISTMPSYWNGKAIVKVQPNAPVHPGDTLLLLNGNHGSAIIQGYYGAADYALNGYDNADFITIQAAPGQKPELDSLAVYGGGKWAFRGLTITNLSTGVANGNAHGYLAAFYGPHHDIIFDGNTVGISYPTNTSQARFHATSTQAQWLATAPSGVFDYGYGYDGGKCVTITNNTIRDVSYGINTMRSNTVLIANNKIDYFLHDGIDHASNNLTIQGNLITNHLDAGDSVSIHPDFIQGDPWGSGSANVDHLSNLVITGNVGIRQTDPNLPFMNLTTGSDWIQGMGTFDGDWTNVTVTNNVVVTSIYQGMSWYGVHNLLIANNTVVSDGLVGGGTPWITVMPSKAAYGSFPSSDVVIKNNVANVITADPSTLNLTIENNLLVAPVGGGITLELPVAGKPTWNSKPGTYGSNNVISAATNATAFKAYSPLTGVFDLHLSSGIAGLGALSAGSVGAYGTGN